MTEVRRSPGSRRANEGGVIDAVRAGSLAEEIGLRSGDRLRAIDGRTLRDAVDFQFYAAEESLTLDIVRGDESLLIEVAKHPDEDLGIDFQDAAFDVWVIPHTLEETNLNERKPGDKVNLEFDVIAKYVERMLPA